MYHLRESTNKRKKKRIRIHKFCEEFYAVYCLFLSFNLKKNSHKQTLKVIHQANDESVCGILISCVRLGELSLRRLILQIWFIFEQLPASIYIMKLCV